MAHALRALSAGEEGETCRWKGEGALFEFADSWKERGRGELRVNSSTASSHAPGRLVMRTKGTSRLLLNAPLWARMALTPMEGGKVPRFSACRVAAADASAWLLAQSAAQRA